MKAKPIKNLLKHNQEVKAKHIEIGSFGLDYTIASTWVDAVTYIMDNYECTPKETK